VDDGADDPGSSADIEASFAGGRLETQLGTVALGGLAVMVVVLILVVMPGTWGDTVAAVIALAAFGLISIMVLAGVFYSVIKKL
jgi:hypothetical protein